MRLFSAIAVPADIAAALAPFRGGLHEARWVESSDYHVTLAFFGDIDRDVAEELAQALDEILADPFDVVLTGLTVFGSGTPHAIVALAERSVPLLALEAKHRAIMARLGVGERARNYAPHVTLARLRRGSVANVADWMSERPVFSPLSFRATEFALFSSATSRGGGPYVAEAVFVLR